VGHPGRSALARQNAAGIRWERETGSIRLLTQSSADQVPRVAAHECVTGRSLPRLALSMIILSEPSAKATRPVRTDRHAPTHSPSSTVHNDTPGQTDAQPISVHTEVLEGVSVSLQSPCTSRDCSTPSRHHPYDAADFDDIVNEHRSRSAVGTAVEYGSEVRWSPRTSPAPGRAEGSCLWVTP
jgi:hypothetical protein